MIVVNAAKRKFPLPMGERVRVRGYFNSDCCGGVPYPATFMVRGETPRTSLIYFINNLRLCLQNKISMFIVVDFGFGHVL
jgi:hypothetical protein